MDILIILIAPAVAIFTAILAARRPMPERQRSMLMMILGFGIVTFGVPVATGAWPWVVALVVAATFCFGGLGLLISTRARTTERGP